MYCKVSTQTVSDGKLKGCSVSVSVEITGADQVIKALERLPISTQTKALRPALRKGATVVRDAASENLKAVVSAEATGLSARSLRVYSLRKINGNLRVAVMVKRGLIYPNRAGQPVRVGLAVSVLEYGKQNQPPRSWIRKAAREKVAAATDAVSQEITKRLDSAVEDAKR